MERPQLPNRLLLVEPQNLLRRTVVEVAAQLRLARIEEATSFEMAEKALGHGRYDGLVVAFDDSGEALAMLERLRQGKYPTPSDAPVVVMASECTAQIIAGMRALGVRRILLKPFKVKDVLTSIASMCGVDA